MRLNTTDEALIALGTQYLQICMFNLGSYVAVVGERLLQATGRANLSMIARVSGCIVNIALDPILIFGLLGSPALGGAERGHCHGGRCVPPCWRWFTPAAISTPCTNGRSAI